MVKLLDCTTRDGGFDTNWMYSDEYIYTLMDNLKKQNIDYYEIGYRNHYDNEDKGDFYNCIPIFVKRFAKHKGNLKLGVMSDIKRFNLDDFQSLENDYIDFIRLATRKEHIKQTLKMADELIKRKYKVFIQVMEIEKVDTEGYLYLSLYKDKSKLEGIYFADTNGCLNPIQVQQYYNKFKTLGFINNICFHAHDKNGNALKNTQKAIELGAFCVDITQVKGSKSGGNLLAKDLIT